MRSLSLLLLVGSIGCSKEIPASPSVSIEPSVELFRTEPGYTSIPTEVSPLEVSAPVDPNAPPVAPSAALESGTAFAYPAGDGGKRLGEALAIGNRAIATEREPRTAKPRSLPAYLNPESGLMVAPEFPVRRLSDVKSLPVRPMPLADRIPADFARLDVDLPEMPKFAVGPLTNAPGLDFRLPAPVPTLARFVPERASLEDPTTEFVPAMVVNPALPLKEAVAPFVRLSLPDPFENAGPARIKNAPKEDLDSVLGTTPKQR